MIVVNHQEDIKVEVLVRKRRVKKLITNNLKVKDQEGDLHLLLVNQEE